VKKRFFCVLVSLVALFPLVARGETKDDLVFIHHSCGSNFLRNNLHKALVAKDYIDERNDITYGTKMQPDEGRPASLGRTPGNQTNMNHWVCWFNDYLEGVKQHKCKDGVNRIIMFKSCYPASDIHQDGDGAGNPFSSSKTVANYKAVFRHPAGPGKTYTHNGKTYKALEDVFRANPKTLFIFVTAPPLRHRSSTDENAHRARVFNNWVKTDWLKSYNKKNPGLNNVAVFDWFDILAFPDNRKTHSNRLQTGYGGASGDSHPNRAANAYSTRVFATKKENFIDTVWEAFSKSK